MAISCNTKPYLTPKSQALATGLAFLTGDYRKALRQANAMMVERPRPYDRAHMPLEVGTVLEKRAVLEPIPSVTLDG